MVKRNVRGGVPSPYPRFLFHGLRTAQLLSSITVSGIMCYFMYYLRLEHYAIPWTFILLLTVSLATIAALTITIIFYNFTYLSPGYNLILNGGCSFLWALGLALLSWSISQSHVLAKQCTGPIWGGEAEASVCRDYKALWSMTLVGTVSTLAALFLDIVTQKRVTRLGKYKLPEDNKGSSNLRDLKATRVRAAGAQPDNDAAASMIWTNEHEQDIGYHNRYGAQDETLPATEPLDATAGEYHGVPFRD